VRIALGFLWGRDAPRWTSIEQSARSSEVLLSESYSGGPLDTLTITYQLDQFLRRTNLVVQQSSTPIIQQSSSFDQASRLRTVGDGTNSATYGYIANSDLIGYVLYTNNGPLRMTRTTQFDNLIDYTRAL
jgi:hypothetical protein